MGDQKSRIEINLGVVRNLLDDIADMIENSAVLTAAVCVNARRDCDRDYKYIAARTRKEGTEFLSVTLPRLGKWYDSLLSSSVRGILEGELSSPTPPVGFKPYVKYFTEGEAVSEFRYPVLCRAYMHVLAYGLDPSPEVARLVRAYRSLFYLFYKQEVPLTSEVKKLATEKWYANEWDLEHLWLPSYYSEDIVRTREILSETLGGEVSFTRITPRNGPGAVAGGEAGDEKWSNPCRINSLHSVYGWYDLYLPYATSQRPRQTDRYWAWMRLLKERRTYAEATSRLLFVPKDSRGPRVIACEPKELMYVQQGVARNLMKILYANSSGRINFHDQSINGNLALQSSKTQEFATVDLKDASDRVGLSLVKLVFPDWAHRYLEATRSQLTLMPDGEVVRNHKYAPMGSALCFPVESLIFWSLAVVAGINSGMTVEDAKRDTYVFGDDIIIRPEAFPEMVRLFSSVGLIVNVEKSYVSGPFRESCGVDAYEGLDVTPFKVKKDLVCRSLGWDLAKAICDMASRCFSLDLRRTGEYFVSLVEPTYRGVIRYYKPLGGLSVVDPLAFDLQGLKHDRQYNTTYVIGWGPVLPKEPTPARCLNRLLKSLHGDWSDYDPSEVVVPRATKIRKRRILVEGMVGG